MMLAALTANYPYSEIFCFTLSTTYMSSNPSFTFPYEFGGRHIEEYNAIIRKAASAQRCGLVDLYAYGTPYDSIDGSHPNASGMSTLAALTIKDIAGSGTMRY